MQRLSTTTPERHLNHTWEKLLHLRLAHHIRPVRTIPLATMHQHELPNKRKKKKRKRRRRRRRMKPRAKCPLCGREAATVEATTTTAEAADSNSSTRFCRYHQQAYENLEAGFEN